MFRQQQNACRSKWRFLQAVGDGGEAGGDVLGMGIVGEADEGDIVGDAEAHLGDGVVGSEGDDVVEGEDGVGPVGAVEKGPDGLGGDVEVDFATGDEGRGGPRGSRAYGE